MFSRMYARVTPQMITKAAAAVLMAGAPIAFAKPKPPPPPVPAASPPVTPVNNQLFSWFETGTPAPSNAAYVGTPFLRDSNVGAVNAYLMSLPPTAVRAVKVEGSGISSATAATIFNNTSYHVSYVFGDLEGANATSAAALLAKQVRYLNNNPSQKTQSSNAYIGNFGFSSQTSNAQAPANYHFTGQHSFSGYGQVHYGFAQLNMSNEEAYPGSPSFRNKAAGDTPSGGGTYPNIRSSLFVLPLWRVGNVEASQQAMGLTSHQNIPYTSNFNNWGNLGLDNDRDASTGFRFTPGVAMDAKTVGGKTYPALSVAQTTDQLLGRRDFATMVTHMRMRGADSVHLLESGINGVSTDQMEDDAATGWNGDFSLNQIFAQSDRALLIGQETDNGSYEPGNKYGDNTTIVVDGVKKNVDQSGAIFSGAYSLNLAKLDVLISNMDDASHTITLPAKIGNYSLSQTDFVVGAGNHWMVEYTLSGNGNKKGWQVAGQHVPYTAIANSRGGFGIPEPGTLSLLAVAGVLGINRRKRDVKTA
jgi:hypothetical protein